MAEVTQEDRDLADFILGRSVRQADLEQIARHRIAAEQRARIEGYNEAIEAAVAAVDEGIDCNGIIARDIASLTKPMKGPTDEA